MIIKGGHGSGIRGHRTLGDATHNMTDAQRRMSLDRLKAEQAKRAEEDAPVAPKPETKPETKPEPKPEIKPETKPETKPEIKPETSKEIREKFLSDYGEYDKQMRGFLAEETKAYNKIQEMKLQAYRVNKEGYMADLAQNKEFNDLTKQQKDLEQKKKELSAKKSKVFKDLIRQPKENRVDIKASGNDKDRVQWVSKELSSLSEFISRDTFNTVLTSVRVEGRDSPRAGYNAESHTMKLPRKDKQSLIHEFGHHIESSNQDIYRATSDFFRRRTQNESAITMRKATKINGFREDEMTKKDGFFNPYVGKLTGRSSTEVLSMGLEEMMKSPASFAKKDPEHFDLILDIISGKIKKRA